MNATLIRNRAAALLNSLGESSRKGAEPTKLEEAAKAFESDMEPVCRAIVSALEDGDIEALKGLRALLPHLLSDVNRAPALADLLAHQLGKSLLEGLNANPEEAL